MNECTYSRFVKFIVFIILKLYVPYEYDVRAKDFQTSKKVNKRLSERESRLYCMQNLPIYSIHGLR